MKKQGRSDEMTFLTAAKIYFAIMAPFLVGIVLALIITTD